MLSKGCDLAFIQSNSRGNARVCGFGSSVERMLTWLYLARNSASGRWSRNDSGVVRVDVLFYCCCRPQIQKSLTLQTRDGTNSALEANITRGANQNEVKHSFEVQLQYYTAHNSVSTSQIS